MHERFVDKWCAWYENACREMGVVSALRELEQRLDATEVARVRARYLSYKREKRRQGNVSEVK